MTCDLTSHQKGTVPFVGQIKVFHSKTNFDSHTCSNWVYHILAMLAFKQSP